MCEQQPCVFAASCHIASCRAASYRNMCESTLRPKNLWRALSSCAAFGVESNRKKFLISWFAEFYKMKFVIGLGLCCIEVVFGAQCNTLPCYWREVCMVCTMCVYLPVSLAAVSPATGLLLSVHSYNFTWSIRFYCSFGRKLYYMLYFGTLSLRPYILSTTTYSWVSMAVIIIKLLLKHICLVSL